MTNLHDLFRAGSGPGTILNITQCRRPWRTVVGAFRPRPRWQQSPAEAAARGETAASRDRKSSETRLLSTIMKSLPLPKQSASWRTRPHSKA
jgi:hypothetical protein